MRVRLIRKFAEQIDGVDLSSVSLGEIVELPDQMGHMLIAEGWAIPERRTAGPARVIAFRRESDPGHAHDHDDVW